MNKKHPNGREERRALEKQKKDKRKGFQGVPDRAFGSLSSDIEDEREDS